MTLHRSTCIPAPEFSHRETKEPVPPQGTLERLLLRTEQTGWSVVYDYWRNGQSERPRFLVCGDSDDPTSLRRERGGNSRSRQAFRGHARLCWSFRLVANRLARDPFDPDRAMNVARVSHQNGISSTASSEFGGGWRRGLGALELRLRDRFRECVGSPFGADS